jgi:hypothetical protein
MSTHYETRPEEQDVSGWAMGMIGTAATVMAVVGFFQVIMGLTAIFNEKFFLATRNYAFDLDVTAWGWIQLVVGAVTLVVGFGLFSRVKWAGVTALVLAFVSALGNFLFIPHYPIWALVVIGLDFWLIWALTRPGAIRT